MDNYLDTYSPTCEALSIIYESMESDSETFKSFIQTGFLMESGASSDIVMESVGDIFKSIANGIKKFIQKIKDFFKKILLYITSAYQDLDKVAAKVKEVIKDKDEINFTIDGYNFSVLDKSGPDISEFQSVVNSYNEDMTKISELKIKEVKEDILKWLEENNLDKIRGEVLGVKSPIASDDYTDSVRKHFRNGELETSSITVTKSMVNSIIDHAKKLEDTKRESIKDRDKLIELLSKSETFFDRTIHVYYENGKKKTNVNKVDISDNKFKTEDNKVEVDDKMIKTITSYATYKSRQVNKIASMVNLVACERVNALKDQIKQERVILRKCLFGGTENKTEKVNESVIFNEAGYKGTEYQVLAMESIIQDFPMYENLKINTLIEESKFILESIRTGEVYYLMEADNTKLGGKVIQAVTKIIDAITKAYRQKAIGSTDKYKPWLDEIEDGLVDKAGKLKEFKMANFVDANENALASNLQTAIKTAYGNKDYTNVSFANKMIPDIKTMDNLKDTGNRKLILNYFRTGKANEALETKTFKSGKELAGKVPEMVKYIRNFGTTVSQPADAINKSFKTASEGFKVMESMITGNTYLDIIGKPVCESDISLCRDYNYMFNLVTESILFEAEGQNPVAGETGKSIVNNTKAAKPETKSGEEITSATSVQATEDPNAKDANGIKEEKTNNAAVDYKKACDNFFKQCVALYLQAREEQFLAYVNAIAAIDGAKPKFDKNGKYISKNANKEESKEATATETK